MRFAALTALLTIAASTAALAAPLAVDAERPFEPPDGERPLRGLRITIDPGHGGSSHTEGYSGSARGVNSGVVEGDLNMLVAGHLYHHLRRGGAEVIMTRQDDQRVTLTGTNRSEELGARVQRAIDSHSHLFLALHHNSAERASADGVVTLIWPTDSHGQDQPLERAFSDILREEVEQQVPHREPFPPLIDRHPLVSMSDIPSAVIEFGFLSNADFDAWVSQRGAHRAEAIGIYNAVVRMWTEHREELEALHTQLFSGESAGAGSEPLPVRRARPDVSRMARNVWPLERPPQTAEEAQFVINTYKRTVLTDATFFHLDATVEGGPGAWRVTGSTNDPRLAGAVESFLDAVGCADAQVDLEILPAASLGEERYGVCAIPMALSFEQPGNRGVQQTQLLLGERVYLLRESDDHTHFLTMAGDGYIGWVRQEVIRRMGFAEFAHWQNAPRARVVRDFMVEDFRVPTGCALPILEHQGGDVRLQIPRAVRATASEEAVTIPLDHLRMPSDPAPGLVAVQTAMTALTVPYVFGGRSMVGLDCSGLVGNAYLTAGLRLPRDARQQILVGEMVGTSWQRGPFQPGDVLFFCDRTGRVTHTGLSLGGQRFIHESPPEVHVSSFDSADPLFDRGWTEAFAFARRPLD